MCVYMETGRHAHNPRREAGVWTSVFTTEGMLHQPTGGTIGVEAVHLTLRLVRLLWRKSSLNNKFMVIPFFFISPQGKEIIAVREKKDKKKTYFLLLCGSIVFGC